MTIESEIKKLTGAIEALTAVIEENRASKTDFDAEQRMETFGPLDEDEKPEAEEAAKESEPEAEEAAEKSEPEAEDDDDEITASSVREMAKSKIQAGAERAEVKKLITDLGADAIGDLDAKGLKKLHKQLGAL